MEPELFYEEIEIITCFLGRMIVDRGNISSGKDLFHETYILGNYESRKNTPRKEAKNSLIEAIAHERDSNGFGQIW